MAINFPDTPTNGQTYNDPGTGQTWTYEQATNSWTASSLATTGGITYKGSVDITAAPPTGAKAGEQWSVGTGGTANAGYGPGITGTITKGSMVMYTGTDWLETSHAVPEANETAKGIAEIATTAEVTAGTDDSRIVTPLKLKQAVDALPPGTTVSTTAPATPENGQAWFDSTNTVLKVWDGTAWQTSTPVVWSRFGNILFPANAGDVVNISAGTAALPGLTPVGDPDTGIYSPGADQVAISTGGEGRLFVDASGQVNAFGAALRCHAFAGSTNLGLRAAGGTSAAPTAISTASNIATINFQGYDGTAYLRPAAIAAWSDGAIGSSSSPGYLTFHTTPPGSTDPDERLRITSAGLVGIGTNSPTEILDVRRTGVNPVLALTRDDAAVAGALYIGAGSTLNFIQSQGEKDLNFQTNSIERARIDSSGRLLVGTSSALTTKYGGSLFPPGFQSVATQGTGGFFRHSANSDGPALIFSKSRDASVGGQAVLVNEDTVGYLGFAGSDGTAFQTAAAIISQVDGTPGANDMPGRIVLSTTAAGASSPTERMRIKSSGIISFSNAPVYADNTAAKAGGLVAGDIYRKADGTLMITF